MGGVWFWWNKLYSLRKGKGIWILKIKIKALDYKYKNLMS